jgi:DNA modification methylase
VTVTPTPADGSGARRRRPAGGTTTSSFGVSRRENHDATGFYARFTAPELSADDVVAAPGVVDEIYVGDSRHMDRVRPSSVALVVTSPPYFAGKAYETELDAEHVPSTYLEYLQMLRQVFSECTRTLEPGGRIAVNVANLGRRPYRNLAADITTILQDDLRLLLRGEVIWVKQRGASGSCAWGSFQRATNPVLRDLTERVIIASKGRFDRPVPTEARAERGLPHESTIFRDEFMDATLDLWEIPPESATRVGHPAPFPVALPERLIHLYTYREDLVLDPFMGSGTTAVAALRAERHFVGYDTDADYVRAAKARIAAEDVAQGAQPAEAPSGELAARPDKAADAARALLAGAGFAVAEGKARRLPGGVRVPWVATDAAGAEWLVLVAGFSTVARSGLRRADVLWRTLG